MIKIHGYRIYKDFILQPNRKLNLIVGANEAGKSTLIEAITLGLTGRINGRNASEELNPYWFNTSIVQEFLHKRKNGDRASFPEISIKLFLENSPELQELCGAINDEAQTIACPGVNMCIRPNKEYSAELDEWAKDASYLLPVEYYSIDWHSFADKTLTARPKQLVTAVIDSRTVQSTSGIDYHLRQILDYHFQPAEKAAISLAYRKAKAEMSGSALSEVSKRIGTIHTSLHHNPIALAMDQSARSSWENSITPHVNDVPFAMSGQGQQAAIKISLAMQRQSGRALFVMVEEPENHLTHTSLTTLLSRIELHVNARQQLFITTHSSFVLNRLGLDKLLMIGNAGASRISDLDADTVGYFQKLPGYDTLRMALAKKVVLVEGPSDEIIFERIFEDIYDKTPMECGIDVLSMRGLSLARCLQLCHALDKNVAVLRDNDGVDPKELKEPVNSWLKAGKRELFIGELNKGRTLEPQLINHDNETVLREILSIRDRANLLTWMTREKTEAAIRIAKSPKKITPPAYIRDAAQFIHG